MKRLFTIILLISFSCSPKISKKEYDKAMELLSYSNSKHDIKLIAHKEVRKQMPIIYKSSAALKVTDQKFKIGDTILSKLDKKMYVFENVKTKNLFFIHFYNNFWHTRFELDSNWNLISYHGMSGEDY